MEHATHLYRFVITAATLGVFTAFPLQASAAEGLHPERGHASQISLAALDGLMPLSSDCTAECQEAIATASLDAASGNAIFESSILNLQRAEGVLVASDYTPPDNGGPDDSRGSGTR
ncbi:MAG: hypothetical protein WBA57_07255 [Elainellaceae cyanobacterium]